VKKLPSLYITTLSDRMVSNALLRRPIKLSYRRKRIKEDHHCRSTGDIKQCVKLHRKTSRLGVRMHFNTSIWLYH